MSKRKESSGGALEHRDESAEEEAAPTTIAAIAERDLKNAARRARDNERAQQLEAQKTRVAQEAARAGANDKHRFMNLRQKVGQEQGSRGSTKR